MRVAIVGGPGIGKSTLLRQLGDLYHTGRTARARRACGIRACSRTSRPGGTRRRDRLLRPRSTTRTTATPPPTTGPARSIFFEGARITLEAHMAEYPPSSHAELRKVLAIGDAWNPDRVIVLTSSTDTIEKHIRLRNRAARRRREHGAPLPPDRRRVPPAGAARIPTRSSSIATARSSTSEAG